MVTILPEVSITTTHTAPVQRMFPLGCVTRLPFFIASITWSVVISRSCIRAQAWVEKSRGTSCATGVCTLSKASSPTAKGDVSCAGNGGVTPMLPFLYSRMSVSGTPRMAGLRRRSGPWSRPRQGAKGSGPRERERLLRGYAADEISWRELRQRGFADYVEVLAGLGEIGLRPPMAPMEGPSRSAREKGSRPVEASAARSGANRERSAAGAGQRLKTQIRTRARRDAGPLMG